MKCNNCQEYGHSVKYCKNVSRCGICSEDHRTESCQSRTLHCYHCKGSHRVGDNNCAKHIFEREITTIQTKEKVNRAQAIIYLQTTNPSNLNYSKALKKTNVQNTAQTSRTIESQDERDNLDNEMEVETRENKRRLREDDTTTTINNKRIRESNELTTVEATPEHLTSENSDY